MFFVWVSLPVSSNCLCSYCLNLFSVSSIKKTTTTITTTMKKSHLTETYMFQFKFMFVAFSSTYGVANSVVCYNDCLCLFFSVFVCTWLFLLAFYSEYYNMLSGDTIVLLKNQIKYLNTEIFFLYFSLKVKVNYPSILNMNHRWFIGIK